MKCMLNSSARICPFFLRFYTYGDIPLENHLETIEELGLSRFDKLQVDTNIPQEPRWKDQVITEPTFNLFMQCGLVLL